MRLEHAERQTSPWVLAWFGLLFAAGLALWCFRTTAFIADDSYFYLVIARNLATQGWQTFSNVFSTNGFHPLWGYLLAGYTYVVSELWPSALSSPRYPLPLSIALVAGVAVQSWRMARRLELDPLVVSALIMGFNLTRGLLYSESRLFFLLLLTMLVELAGDAQIAARRPFSIGLLAGAIVLTRLDSVFLVGLILLYSLWICEDRLRAMMACGVCGAVVLAYVLSNIYYFGGPVPISGWIKSSFPRIFLTGWTAHGMRMDFCGYSLLFGWVPLLFGAAVWAISHNVNAAQRRVLALLWLGTALHCSYVVLFMRGHTVWPWYYVQAITLAAVAAGIAIRQSIPVVNRGAALCVISVLVVGGYAQKLSPRATPAAAVIDFLREHDIHGETILVSDWPGAVAFYTDNHVLAADMLTFNRRQFEEMRSHSNAMEYLLTECERRGAPLRHIIIVGSEWLVWDPKTRQLTFNDPRKYPELEPIGTLTARETENGEWVCNRGVRLWFTKEEAGVEPGEGEETNRAGKYDTG